MLAKIFKIAGILLLVAFIVGTLAFTSIDHKKVECTEIEVSFNDKDPIHVSAKELLRLVSHADSKILGKMLNEINSESIEEEVSKHQAIQKADVYKIVSREEGVFKGTLVVKVKHRKPILRVMSESGRYYLDKQGNKVPDSPNYTTNVLVASGYIDEKFAVEQLLPFVLFVENNDFWKAQIQQVYVEKNGDVQLVPLVGDHIIELGDVDNFERKLQKMRAFYEQVLVKNSWNKYDVISLKYNNQVIAKRN